MSKNPTLKSAVGRGFFLTATLLAGSALRSNPALADQEGEARSFQALAAQWWQFALSIPKSVNPLTDETGQNCMVGQRGNVWFLGGVFNTSGTATRACNIPEGKTLFFPVINSIGVNSPGACGQGTAPLNVADLRKMNQDAIDSVTTKTATLDQAPLDIRLESSKVFDVTLPQDNLFSDPSLPPCPAGVYSPAVDEGYYVKLKGLSAGAHVLDITGSTPAFTLHVIYNLEVVPVNLE
jgi:hypothetical protein